MLLFCSIQPPHKNITNFYCGSFPKVLTSFPAKSRISLGE